MGKTKKYWWLKLSEEFFNAKEIKFLRRVAGGDTFALIYQRMMILSLSTGGKLYFENVGNTFAEEIAVELDEDIKNVEMTMNYLKGKGLINFGDSDNVIEFKQVPSLIGSETNWARYKADSRKNKIGQIPTEVQLKSRHKESESEQEKESKLNKESDSKDDLVTIQMIYDFFQNNFGMVSPNKLEQLRELSEENPKELVLEALKVSDNFNAKSPIDYASSILKQWARTNIKTLKDVETSRQAQAKSKQATSQTGKVVKPAPEWSNINKPEEKKETSDDELKDLEDWLNE